MPARPWRCKVAGRGDDEHLHRHRGGSGKEAILPGCPLGSAEIRRWQVQKHRLSDRIEIHREGNGKRGSQGAAQHVPARPMDGREREPAEDKRQLLVDEGAGGRGRWLCGWLT